MKRTELARWLHAEDLEMLERPLAPADWYDIKAYARVCELLREVEGEGRDEYLHDRGVRTGERLLEAGLYAQLEYVTRMKIGQLREPIDRYQAFGRDLKLLVTISSSILNFSKWSVASRRGARAPLPHRRLRGGRVPRGARLDVARLRELHGARRRRRRERVALGAPRRREHRVPDDAPALS